MSLTRPVALAFLSATLLLGGCSRMARPTDIEETPVGLSALTPEAGTVLVSTTLTPKDDYRAEATFTFKGAPTDGTRATLLFGVSKDRRYRFDLTHCGHYSLSVEHQGQTRRLIRPKPFPVAIETNTPIRLAVERFGDRIFLYANGQEIDKVLESYEGHPTVGCILSDPAAINAEGICVLRLAAPSKP